MANSKNVKGKQPPQRRTRMVRTRRPRLRKDPMAWAMLSGMGAAVAVLVAALARQYWGAMAAPPSLLLWVLIAFVLSYGVGGCFAFFVISVAKEARDRPAPPERVRRPPAGTPPAGTPEFSIQDAPAPAADAAAVAPGGQETGGGPGE